MVFPRSRVHLMADTCSSLLLRCWITSSPPPPSCDPSFVEDVGGTAKCSTLHGCKLSNSLGGSNRDAHRMIRDKINKYKITTELDVKQK